MRICRAALEFRMELASFEIGVVLEFHHFDELSVGRCTCNLETRLFKLFAEFAVVVEFVAVTVAFADACALVKLCRIGILGELAGVSAESHGAAFFRDVLLFVHQVDNWVGRFFVELGRVGILPAENVTCEFNHAALHAEANAKQRNFMFACITDGNALAVYATATETARNQNAVSFLDEVRILFELFSFDAFHLYLGIVCHAGVLQSFVHGLVSVADGDVLAHKRDGAFVFWFCSFLDKAIPFGMDDWMNAQMKLF